MCMSCLKDCVSPSLQAKQNANYQGTLFELLLAANYLDIKGLWDVTCKAVANMIKGKTSEEIGKIFNLKNDFTPSEEEQVRQENELLSMYYIRGMGKKI